MKLILRWLSEKNLATEVLKVELQVLHNLLFKTLIFYEFFLGEELSTLNLMSKVESRAHAKTVLEHFFNVVDKSSIDSKLNENLNGLLQQLFLKGFCWGASFKAIDSEPVISLDSSKGITYPRVLTENKMQFIAPGAGRWVPNQWDILEPDPETGKVVMVSDHDFVLVPGVAFDQGGHRLGRGKAFYDTALSNYSGVKIGVGYSVQMISDLWTEEAHDIQMNYLVTEKFILQVKSRKSLPVH